MVFLLGKPPRPSTIFPEVFQRLEASGAEVTVQLPHDEPVEAGGLTTAGLVVHRGLDDRALALVAGLDSIGVPVCNPLRGTRVTADRAVLAAALTPRWAPASTVAQTWAEVLELVGSRRCVVKAAHGGGRGSSVLAGTRSELPADPGTMPPYVVQEFVPNEGVDHKLYVAGRQVRGLLKPSSLTGGHTSDGEPFEPGAELLEMARDVGAALDLHLYGVDVLLGEAGPVVVDVNDFPGYRRIADAPALVTEHLADALSLS